MYRFTTFACLVTTALGAATFKPYSSSSDSGCGTAPYFPEADIKDEETSNGRHFRIWLPDAYDENKPTPLILSFHGKGGDIEKQMNVDRLTKPEFNEDHIVIYMQGALNDEGRSTWFGAPGANSDDKGFTEDVLNFAQERFCLDEKRVYATGKSQGGGFVGQLACDAALSPRFAAFAPVSGAYYITDVDRKQDCHPENVTIPCAAPDRPGGVPVMAFHGGADDVIKYDGGWRGGACLPAVPHWAGAWALRDGLRAPESNHREIPGSVNGEIIGFGEGLVTLVYDGDDVGHVWPNRDNSAFEASNMIMDFFREHSLES